MQIFLVKIDDKSGACLTINNTLLNEHFKTSKYTIR